MRAQSPAHALARAIRELQAAGQRRSLASVATQVTEKAGKRCEMATVVVGWGGESVKLWSWGRNRLDVLQLVPQGP